MSEVQRKRERQLEEGTQYCDKCDETFVIGAPLWVKDHYHWANGRPALRTQWQPELTSRVGAPLRQEESKRVGKCRAVCVWFCSVCGKQRLYSIHGPKHAGPTTRLLDLRYGLAYCDGSSYPSHKRAFGTIDGARGPVVFYHDGAPNPPQPEQTHPVIKEIQKRHEESLPKSTRKQCSRGEGTAKVERKARRRNTDDQVLEERPRKVRAG